MIVPSTENSIFPKMPVFNVQIKDTKITILQLIAHMAFGVLENTIQNNSLSEIYKKINELDVVIHSLEDPVLRETRISLQNVLIQNIQQRCLGYFGKLSQDVVFYERVTQEVPVYHSLSTPKIDFYEKLQFLANFKITTRSNYNASIYTLSIALMISEIAAILTQFTTDSDLINLLYNKDSAIDHRCQLIRNVHKAGANLNFQDEEGFTLLHKADHPTVVEQLLICGAIPNIQDKWGDTPLHVALSNEKTQIVKLLCAAKANLEIRNICRQTPIFRVKKVADLELLLKSGAHPNLQDCDGNTPLHVFTRWSSIDVIKALCAHGVPYTLNARKQGALEYAQEDHNKERANATSTIIQNAFMFYFARAAKEAKEKEELEKKRASPLPPIHEVELISSEENEEINACQEIFQKLELDSPPTNSDLVSPQEEASESEVKGKNDWF